jgi:hypothetical protein
MHRDEGPDDPFANTYLDAEHGPDPVPEWVITEDAARQYELGLLKTGKEAEVFLVERELGDRRQLLAAKRYRCWSNARAVTTRYELGARPETVVSTSRCEGTARYRVPRTCGRGPSSRRSVGCGPSACRCRIRSALGTEVMLEYIGDEERWRRLSGAACPDRDSRALPVGDRSAPRDDARRRGARRPRRTTC